MVCMSDSGLSSCVAVGDVVFVTLDSRSKSVELVPSFCTDLGFCEEKMNTRASRRTRSDNRPVDARPDWLKSPETVAARARSSARIAVAKAVMRLSLSFAGMYDNLNADNSA